MNTISLRDVLSGATLLVAIGIWIGGINNLKQQTLLGIEDIEAQLSEQHGTVMTALADQGSRIEKIEGFLSDKFPQEYIPVPDDPRTQMINKYKW